MDKYTELLALYEDSIKLNERMYNTYESIMECRPMYLTGEEIKDKEACSIRYTYHKMKNQQFKRGLKDNLCRTKLKEFQRGTEK